MNEEEADNKASKLNPRCVCVYIECSRMDRTTPSPSPSPSYVWCGSSMRTGSCAGSSYAASLSSFPACFVDSQLAGGPLVYI